MWIDFLYTEVNSVLLGPGETTVSIKWNGSIAVWRLCGELYVGSKELM